MKIGHEFSVLRREIERLGVSARGEGKKRMGRGNRGENMRFQSMWERVEENGAASVSN
jgi:hypothetical protein